MFLRETNSAIISNVIRLIIYSLRLTIAPMTDVDVSTIPDLSSVINFRRVD